MYIRKNVHWETQIGKTVLQSSLRPQKNPRGVGSRADNERQPCLTAFYDPTLVVDLEADEVPVNGFGIHTCIRTITFIIHMVSPGMLVQHYEETA